MGEDKKLQIRNSTAEFLVFTKQAGENSIEVRVEDETVWLTQKLIATLFDVSVPTINEHLKNIFSSGELVEDSVIRKFRITAADGKQYSTYFYNLDAIISAADNSNGGRTDDSLGKKGVLGERLGEKLGETRSRIVALLATNSRISTREIATKIGVSTTAIDKHIIVLKNKGVIKRVGSARGGHWEVLT